MKRILSVILLCLLCVSLFSCSKEQGDEYLDITKCHTTTFDKSEEEHTLFVQFQLQGGATFVVELLPEYAPLTVRNFQNLVADGFYDGLTFHRICRDFMVQGGCPEGTGYGRADTTVPGEFSLNGYAKNTLKHERGVISMARGADYDSASCQFFIVQGEASHLDHKYAAFGRVVAGMETIDAMADLCVTAQISGEESKPKNPPIIEKATFINFTNPNAA